MAWSKSYRAIDKELQSLPSDQIPTDWPSAYVSESSVRESVGRIHSLFIHASADSQICLPSDVLERTERRIALVNLYGPETFEESLIDPIKTMKRDILPRFLRSTFYLDMMRRLRSVEVLPTAADLELPIPPNSLTFQSAEEIPADRRFKLQEIVENRHLYGKFLSYLQQCFCSENLICYRMVTLFEEMVLTKKPSADIADLAWDIYRFFVADGAVYEISIEFASRKAIMLQLAKPRLDTFDFVKRSSLSMLKTIYVSFKTTVEYAELAGYLRSKYSRGPLHGCLPTKLFHE